MYEETARKILDLQSTVCREVNSFRCYDEDDMKIKSELSLELKKDVTPLTEKILLSLCEATKRTQAGVVVDTILDDSMTEDVKRLLDRINSLPLMGYELELEDFAVEQSDHLSVLAPGNMSL